MTDRVYECRSGPVDLDRSMPRPRERRQQEKPRGFLAAAICALMLVPLAGAAEKQGGPLVASYMPLVPGYVRGLVLAHAVHSGDIGIVGKDA